MRSVQSKLEIEKDRVEDKKQEIDLMKAKLAKCEEKLNSV